MKYKIWGQSKKIRNATLKRYQWNREKVKSFSVKLFPGSKVCFFCPVDVSLLQ
jgi:hypothetical protein